MTFTDELLDPSLIELFVTALIILPVVVALILTYFGEVAKSKLVNNYGNYSQILIGGLGVIIHELSHLGVALLFLHKIDNFKLLEPFSVKQTQTLGYVVEEPRNPRNIYEKLGEFFIGLAPCFICSVILWIIHGLFFGNQKMNYGINDNNIMTALKVAENDILTPFGSFGWQLLIYLILIIMISCTGYGLSKEDWHNAMTGYPYWIGLIVLMYTLVVFSGNQVYISGLLWNLIVLLLVFAGRGLIYLLITIALIIIIRKII